MAVAQLLDHFSDGLVCRGGKNGWRKTWLLDEARGGHVNKTKDRIADECCYQEAQRTVSYPFPILVGLSRDLVGGGIH